LAWCLLPQFKNENAFVFVGFPAARVTQDHKGHRKKTDMVLASGVYTVYFMADKSKPTGQYAATEMRDQNAPVRAQ
jgi:hypothetical protein